jgi:hypothetical protein
MDEVDMVLVHFTDYVWQKGLQICLFIGVYLSEKDT